MCTEKLLINAKLTDNCLVGIHIDHFGTIRRIFEMEYYYRSDFPYDISIIDVGENLVTLGLIDTHIHGIGGYATDDAKESSILEMSRILASFGVTGFFPTLYAGNVNKMEKEILAIVSAMKKEEGAKILGINLEGPFLNPVKSGAQDKDNLSLPNKEIFERLIKAGRGKIKAMTIAPELEGIEEIISLAKKYKVVLLMGHTNASYEDAKRAMNKGILHATHFFNAMSAFNHKNPGVSGAVLMDERPCCEIIADGVHVNKDLVRYVIDKKKHSKVVLITDSLSPTSLGEGYYNINGFNVKVGENGAFVDADNPSVLCGSSLTLNKAVRNVISWGTEPSLAIRMATENPARIYNLKKRGKMRRTYKADLVIFDDDFNAKTVFIDGNIVKEG